MLDPILTSEMNKLTPEQRMVVRACIEAVRDCKRHFSEPAPGGEAYAYPHFSGGVAWGFNGDGDGFNIARGIEE